MKPIFAVFLLVAACAPQDPPSTTKPEYRGAHRNTLQFAEDDNSEIIKLLPHAPLAILVASKARKVTLLSVENDELVELRSASLFPGDPSDGELTHIDFDSSGSFAVVTRTKPITNTSGELIDCQGSLVFIRTADDDTFGEIIREVEVGAMPDAVDISDDDTHIVSADEVDFNDGKCPLDNVVPRVSILSMPGGDPMLATVVATIEMVHDADKLKREPEQVIIADDNDHVLVTLQDTHEVLAFSIDDIVSRAAPVLSSATHITQMPNRASGAEPWPDGVHRFRDQNDDPYFAVAGEFNDTVHFFDLTGNFVGQLELTTADLPGDFPRAEPPAALRPDSVASFRFEGSAHLALSLKNVGAVMVLRVDDIAHPVIVQVIKVGDEIGPQESALGTEGISANDEGIIVTANEQASSASLVTPN